MLNTHNYCYIKTNNKRFSIKKKSRKKKYVVKYCLIFFVIFYHLNV